MSAWLLTRNNRRFLTNKKRPGHALRPIDNISAQEYQNNIIYNHLSTYSQSRVQETWDYRCEGRRQCEAQEVFIVTKGQRGETRCYQQEGEERQEGREEGEEEQQRSVERRGQGPEEEMHEGKERRLECKR